MIGNFTKVFARSGQEFYLCELRGGVLPHLVVMVAGFLAGWIMVLIPGMLLVILRLLVHWVSGGASLAVVSDISFSQYFISTMIYGFLFGAVGIGLSLLRRLGVRRNLYVSFAAGPGVDFQVGLADIGSVVGFTLAILGLSTVAREFYIMIIFASVLLGFVWLDVQDRLLHLYALLSQDHAAESVFSIWEVIRRFDEASGIVLRGVGVKDGGRALVIKAFVPHDAARKFLQRLPERIQGVDSVTVHEIGLSAVAGSDGKTKQVLSYI